MAHKTAAAPAAIDIDLDALVAGVAPVAEVQKKARAMKKDLTSDPVYVAELQRIRFIHDVREALARLKWSQAELARRMNKKPQYVSRVLDEEREENFTLSTIAEFACALGLDLQLQMTRHFRDSYVARKPAASRRGNPWETVEQGASPTSTVCFVYEGTRSGSCAGVGNLSRYVAQDKAIDPVTVTEENDDEVRAA